MRTHTHTYTHTYIYIYIYMCECVCVYMLKIEEQIIKKLVIYYEGESTLNIPVLVNLHIN